MTQQISRRTFMQAAGAAALGAATLGAGWQAHAVPLEGRIKKALKYGMIGGDASPLEKLTLVKELGYEGVEPTVRERVDHDELLAASEATGVKVHGVVNGSVEDIPRAIDLAVHYGADSVLLVAGRVNEDKSYADNYTETQAIIREAVPYAAEKEILLLVENVWNNFLLSPLEKARYIDEFESEWVASYFDGGNVMRFGYPEHWIPVLGERIKKLDIKEYSRDKQLNEGLWKGFDVPIGEGSTDWAAFRRELVAIDYHGWATAEVPGGGREELADISRRMDEVLGLG